MNWQRFILLDYALCEWAMFYSFGSCLVFRPMLVCDSGACFRAMPGCDSGACFRAMLACDSGACFRAMPACDSDACFRAMPACDSGVCFRFGIFGKNNATSGLSV